MAIDNRTFTLIGKFEDGITPNLKKISKEINNLSKFFSNLESSLKPVSRGLTNLSKSTDTVSKSFMAQRNSVESSIRAMSAYAKEAGRVVAANKAIERSAKAAGGGRTPPEAGGAGGGGSSKSSAAAVGGLVAGQQLAGMISGAIVRGFQVGVSIMQKPFQYAVNAFGERMQDELSDIQSAGGMFSIDKRDKMGVFKSFEDAREFQKQLNVRLAQSAAALPGATEDYVKQAKQLTDNMMLAYSKNKKSFMEFAKTLGPVAGERDALGLVLQKFTEKSVLLGMGSGGSSSYGVPQILAMLLDQERVNVRAFQRFSAYQSNPLLKNALENAQPELAKTVKGSSERLKLIQKVLDEAVPNEVVMALKNSLSGVKEAIRSGLLDPEAGLFGLGRALNLSVPKVNALGQYLDENGRVVNDVNRAVRESASLYDLLRETLGGFVLPLSELVGILPQIFDPLEGIGRQMVDFRGIAQRFYRNFNQYVAEFEYLSKSVGGAAGGKIKSTAGARGALLAFSDLLTDFGAFKETDFTRISKQLQNPNVNFANVGKEIFSTLFNSDFMKTVGEVIGSVVGSTLKMVGDLMAGVTDMTEAGPFAQGLKSGWDKAKGSIGVTLIFRSLLRVIFNGLVNLFKSAPLETSIFAGLTLGLPVLQGAIAAGITKVFESVLTGGRAGAAMKGMAGGGKFIPGASLAFGALDVAMRMGSGQDAGRAIGGAAATAIGATLGGILGQAIIPVPGVGAAVGMVAGGVIGDKIGSYLLGPSDAQRAAAEAQKAAADAMNRAQEGAAGKYFDPSKLGGVEAISQRFGGGAGLLKALSDPAQVKQLGLSPEGVQQAKILAGYMTQLNGAVSKTKSAQDTYSRAVALNTGNQETARKRLEEAQTAQRKLEASMRKAWETTSSSERLRLTTAANALSGAINEAASKLRRGSSIGETPGITAKPVYAGTPGRKMGLFDAIATEMAHKPAGTDLLIANSSETVIPAAGGWAGSMASGFDVFTSAAKKLAEMAGGMSGLGDIISVGKKLLSMGLQVGENPYFQYGMGFLPGGGGRIGRHAKNSYHYRGRALDVSGPPGLLDAAYAQLKGTNPAELLWRSPGHYDHLHVAYAMGAGMPAFFSSQRAAMDWERKATLGNVKVSSITSNSSEGMGGAVSVNAPITIYQQPGQNSEQLAALVAMELSNAINQARSSSMYV